MWWGGSSPMDLYLGTTVAGLACRGQPRRWVRGCPPEQALAELLAAARAAKRGLAWRTPGITLWLSAGLARPFIIAPIAGLQRRHEIEAVAQVEAVQAGLAAPIKVWVDDEALGRPRLAAATPEPLLAVARELARSNRVRLVAARPWWSSVLQSAVTASPRPRLLAVCEPDGLCVLGGEDGFDLASSYVPSPHAAELKATLARVAMTAGVEEAATSVARFIEDETEYGPNTDGGFQVRWERAA